MLVPACVHVCDFVLVLCCAELCCVALFCVLLCCVVCMVYCHACVCSVSCD